VNVKSEKPGAGTSPCNFIHIQLFILCQSWLDLCQLSYQLGSNPHTRSLPSKRQLAVNLTSIAEQKNACVKAWSQLPDKSRSTRLANNTDTSNLFISAVRTDPLWNNKICKRPKTIHLLSGYYLL